jgi:Asp-tRNA(Asn)/Glu-tRNA(Gln) amidotransferase A subunit family amidase
MKVMRQNKIDVFVNPVNTSPVGKIAGPVEPTINDRPSGRFPHSADWGIPEIAVPAGFNQVVFEPKFTLNAAKTNYNSVTGTVQSLLPHPLPISIAFWAGPGDEPVLIKVAAAYEAATKHRKAPEGFPPLPPKP